MLVVAFDDCDEYDGKQRAARDMYHLLVFSPPPPPPLPPQEETWFFVFLLLLRELRYSRSACETYSLPLFTHVGQVRLGASRVVASAGGGNRAAVGRTRRAASASPDDFAFSFLGKQHARARS